LRLANKEDILLARPQVSFQKLRNGTRSNFVLQSIKRFGDNFIVAYLGQNAITILLNLRSIIFMDESPCGLVYFTKVSEEHIASIFTAKEEVKLTACLCSFLFYSVLFRDSSY
jgi:hypothetical protein